MADRESDVEEVKDNESINIEDVEHDLKLIMKLSKVKQAQLKKLLRVMAM